MLRHILNSGNFYSFVVITIVSIIPYLTGALSAYPIRDKNFGTDSKKFLFRTIFITAAGLIFISAGILLTDPVPEEGWLRTIYAVLLYTTQAPAIFLLFYACKTNHISIWQTCIFSLFYAISAPVGMILHHPWNWLAFLSPLYWIAWAWLVESPRESLIYGAIALTLTSGIILLVLKRIGKLMKG